MDREDIVAAVVEAAGKQLIGRVRLQKTLYLLDRLGLNSGFGYEYHHYGPYSRDLDSATADAKAFGLIRERLNHRQSDGAMYSIFESVVPPSEREQVFGALGRNKASALADRFSQTNVTVLELAATIDWLWRNEGYADWEAEVARRKGAKVRHGRFEKAVELLKSIGLSPPEVSPREDAH